MPTRQGWIYSLEATNLHPVQLPLFYRAGKELALIILILRSSDKFLGRFWGPCSLAVLLGVGSFILHLAWYPEETWFLDLGHH